MHLSKVYMCMGVVILMILAICIQCEPDSDYRPHRRRQRDGHRRRSSNRRLRQSRRNERRLFMNLEGRGRRRGGAFILDALTGEGGRESARRHMMLPIGDSYWNSSGRSSREMLMADGPLHPESREVSSSDTGDRLGASTLRDVNSTDMTTGVNGHNHSSEIDGEGSIPEGSSHHDSTSEVEVDEAEDELERWRTRERNKQARLFMIQTQILQGLGLRNQPNVTNVSAEEKQRLASMYYEQTQQQHPQQQTMTQQQHLVPQHRQSHEHEEVEEVEQYYFAKRYHTFVPLCDRPPRCDAAWDTGGSVRLFFEPKLPSDTSTQITSATLRLYKKAVHDENVDPANVGDYVTSVQTLLTITAYKYQRPVRINHQVRRERICSVFVDASYEGWVKLDVKSAVMSWLHHPKRNYGLVVNTQLNQHALQRHQVFTHTLLCLNDSDNLQLQFPLVPTGDLSVGGVSASSGEGSIMPFLDITTVDVPTILGGTGSETTGHHHDQHNPHVSQHNHQQPNPFD